MSSYSSDQPITSKSDDRFKRWPFAKRIADTLATRADDNSVVLGIYGVWGDGKTSALKLIEQELAAYDHVVVLQFNPWLFGSGTQLIESFFATLAEGIGAKLTTKKEDFGKALMRYGSLLSLAGVGDGEKLGAALSSVTLDELRGRIQRELDAANKRIVVLIDDIDRLERDEIQSIFKLVKIAAGFQRVCYVLAFDDEIVSAALGARYGAGNEEAGRRFLEKIVQVPLPLPPADPDTLKLLAFEGVDTTLKDNHITLNESETNTFVRHFMAGLQPRFQTPRIAKLYANSLAFAIPILKGEVNIVDQMLVEGMRVCYPGLYAKIRKCPDIVLGPRGFTFAPEDWREKSKKSLGEELQDLEEAENTAAWELLEALFPRLESNFGPDFEESWNTKRRVCARGYFHRYFHYGVPPGDVSDNSVQELVLIAERKGDLGPAFAEMCDSRSASRFVSKLRMRENSLVPDASETIALALATAGDHLRSNDGLFGWASTREQASILISNLLRRLPPGEQRDNLGRRLISEASPLPFATEILRNIHDAKGEEPLFTSEVRSELGSILARRIKEHSEPVYKTWPQDAGRLLNAWQVLGPAGEAKAYLETRLHVEPCDAKLILLAFTGTYWSLSSGLSGKSDFEKANYDAVVNLIDPALLLNALEVMHGDALKNPQYFGEKDRSTEERLAHQFASIHQGVIAESSKLDASSSEEQKPTAMSADLPGSHNVVGESENLTS